MNRSRPRSGRSRRRDEGNFIILGLFFLLLMVLLLFFVQDALRKKTLEDSLQRLTDNAALHAAAAVPSVQVSFVSDTEWRPWMGEQGYQVGDYVPSAANAAAIDEVALTMVREYVAKNAVDDQTSGAFGGNLEIVRVSPKFTAHQTGEGTSLIEYYVEVVLQTHWASSLLGRSADLQTTAIAKAVVEHEALYSKGVPDYENPDAISVFANGVYGKLDVVFNNIPDSVTIVGDVHSDDGDVKMNNVPNGAVVDGTVSGVGLSLDANVTAENGTLSGAANPDIDFTFPPWPVDANDPNYPHPIIIIEGNYTIDAGFPASVGADSGTLYVKGDLIFDGTGGDPEVTGDWCFAVQDDIHFNELNAAITGTGASNDISFMVGGTLHFNNLRGPATIRGSFITNSDLFINNAKSSDYPLTIVGGVYSTGKVTFDNLKDGITIIDEPMPNALPEPWVTYPNIYSTPPQYSSPRVMLIH